MYVPSCVNTLNSFTLLQFAPFHGGVLNVLAKSDQQSKNKGISFTIHQKKIAILTFEKLKCSYKALTLDKRVTLCDVSQTTFNTFVSLLYSWNVT